jgi:ribosomal-protein-alanine N-acetyltransferase
MSGIVLPPIVSSSVTLRCFLPEDAPKVYAMSLEPGMRAWLPDQVYDSERQALEVIRYLIGKYADPGNPARVPIVLGVQLNGDPGLIGHVGLSPLEGEVEVGYAIEDRHRGRGYASEAVRVMSEWGLRSFGLPRILGIVATDNAASCRVLERACFQLVSESPGLLHGRQGLVRTYRRTSGSISCDGRYGSGVWQDPGTRRSTRFQVDT